MGSLGVNAIQLLESLKQHSEIAGFETKYAALRSSKMYSDGYSTAESITTNIVEEELLLLDLHYKNVCSTLLQYYVAVILSGNYLDFETIKEELENIENFIYSYTPYFELSDPTTLSSKYVKVYDRLLELSESKNYTTILPVFQRIKKMMLRFIDSIKLSMDFKNEELVIDRTSNGEESFSAEILDYVKGLELVLELVKIEHFTYRPDKRSIGEILFIRDSFENLDLQNDDSTLKKAVKSKTEFLLYKIFRRTGQDVLRYTSSDKTNIISTKEVGFEEWTKFIEAHYAEGESAKTKQREILQQLSDVDIAKYSYKDIHNSIKINKDDFKKEDDIEAFTKLIDGKDFSTKYERFCKKIMLSYIFNNLISLKLEVAGLSPKEIGEIYQNIRTHQHRSAIYNYFPWLKLADYIIRRIDDYATQSFVENQDYLSTKDAYDSQVVSQLTKHLSNTYSKLQESFLWSNSRSFRPFQSELEGCNSEMLFKMKNIGEFRLFFFSSYTIPIDYEKVEVQVKKVDLYLQNIPSYVNTLTSLASMLKKLQNANEDFKESKKMFKKQERRSVEILGIFSAIALFSVGSIQIFKDNTALSTEDVLGFILAYGFSLTLFIFLLWIITREDITKVNWFHTVLLIFYVLAFFLIYILLARN